jgi:hypothetical protein
MTENKKRRIWSFVVGGIALAVFIAFGISGGETVYGIVTGIMGFTFVSCLILKNTFLPDLVGEIMSWGFVQMPGLIFTLDLDGIIWLLSVKLLFFVLGILLALFAGAAAILIGAVVSIFVYPFSIVKNFKGGQINEF